MSQETDQALALVQSTSKGESMGVYFANPHISITRRSPSDHVWTVTLA
jgi:hypothetical protein